MLCSYSFEVLNFKVVSDGMALNELYKNHFYLQSYLNKMSENLTVSDCSFYLVPIKILGKFLLKTKFIPCSTHL